MDAVGAVITAMWLMLPAYIPNNVAVLVGGGPPIDGGRTLGGDRLLGDGKTWRGAIGGIAAGVVLAVALNGLQPAAADLVGRALPTFPVAAIFALPAGALLGDITASFLKRRLGHERGASIPGLDQYDLVVGSLGLTTVAAWPWVTELVTWPVFVVIVIATPVLHRLTNAVAYLLGLKDVPW